MQTITNECVGCGNYCINCGAKETVRYVCDRCGEADKLYCFGDEDLCSYCLEDAFSELKTSEGVCDICGEKCEIYDELEMCRECFFENIETVEESE